MVGFAGLQIPPSAPNSSCTSALADMCNVGGPSPELVSPLTYVVQHDNPTHSVLCTRHPIEILGKRTVSYSVHDIRLSYVHVEYPMQMQMQIRARVRLIPRS